MSYGIAVVLVVQIVTVFAGCGKVDTAGEAPPGKVRPKIGADQLALKIDPYCKMSVEHHTVSDVYTYKEKQYGFCSSYCKDEFAKDPEKYLGQLKSPESGMKK